MEYDAKWLKEQRTRHGMTQDELAARLFVTRQTISSWENGRTSINADMLNRLRMIFDTEYSENIPQIAVCRDVANIAQKQKLIYRLLGFIPMIVCIVCIVCIAVISMMINNLPLFEKSFLYDEFYGILALAMLAFGVSSANLVLCKSDAWLKSKLVVAICIAVCFLSVSFLWGYCAFFHGILLPERGTVFWKIYFFFTKFLSQILICFPFLFGVSSRCVLEILIR